MTRSPAATALRVFISAASLAMLCACATTPAPGSLVVGQQATVEGTITRVDTAPWAYDGNAVIVIATTGRGAIDVQVPARWNLCKASAPDVQMLKPGDRVQATGAVTAPGQLVICAQPTHRLHKIEE
jgi:hypothetical protein